jgi:cytochrome c
MKKTLLVVAAMAMFSTAAIADGMTLAKNNMCLACHAIDKKLVGPAFKDVAAKYATRKDAVEYLTKKIKSGGSGVWGAIPMPAQPQLTDVQAKELARWVLTAK